MIAEIFFMNGETPEDSVEIDFDDEEFEGVALIRLVSDLNDPLICEDLCLRTLRSGDEVFINQNLFVYNGRNFE